MSDDERFERIRELVDTELQRTMDPGDATQNLAMFCFFAGAAFREIRELAASR